MADHALDPPDEAANRALVPIPRSTLPVPPGRAQKDSPQRMRLFVNGLRLQL